MNCTTDVKKFLTELGRNQISHFRYQQSKLNELKDELSKNYHTCLLTEHQNMDFLFVRNTKGLFKYSPEQFMQNGLNWVSDLIQPEDFARQPKLFKDFFNLYFTIPVTERKKYTFCNDFRCLGKDGKYRWLLQEVRFLETSSNGEPQLSVSTYTDITLIKTNYNLNLYVGRYNSQGLYQIKTHLFYPHVHKGLKLSDKELKILKLISEGFLSKHIAEKLNISFNTVNTHRRNMLKKTGTKTSSELVKLARDHGII